ncbi:oxidoreductase [Phycisphaerae bacterium]|nr:oxidoreductase [Phycisphaerae bacterium]
MTSLPILSRAQVTPIGRARGLDEDGREDLARELANAVEGEVRFDGHNRMLYATDASLYQVEPVGVVIPSSVEDAAAAVRFCSERGLPILPRGGGTSLAGQCTNLAVVIDVSARCRHILEVNAGEKFVRVEPGITVDDLNDAIAGTGLFFAPDPATARHASIGGCIGNNAAGSRSVRYGRTSESVIAIDACLADGTRVEFAAGSARRDARVAEITRRVVALVRKNEALIRERFPKTIRRNAGYGLDMILQQLDKGVAEEDVNLSPLLCGSEGTLAMTLGAKLALHERPKAKALAVLSFATLDDAIEAVIPILATKPSAVELLDDLVVSLARANTEYRKYVELLPAPPGGSGELNAVLYVEYFGASEAEVRERVDALKQACPASPVQVHTNATAMMNAWKLRKAGEPLLHGVPGSRKPITFVEDNAIPVENLATFVKELRKIVESHGTRAAFYAHASVGVLHVRPLIDIHDEADRERMRAIAVATADLARSLGGVMSGEHGDGRVRGPLLERYFGAEMMQAFRELKLIFDPAGLLNPGNVVDVAGDSPRPVASMTQQLRVEPEPGRPAAFGSVETSFDFSDQHGLDGAVEMCNGSGVCRKKQGGTMCPSYMATLDERHSTRGRGNALRLAITGQLKLDTVGEASQPDADVWSDKGTMQTLDLCLSCKACKTECPSNVDISKLKAEYTSQRYRRHGVPIAARIMGQIRTLNKLGAMMPGVANAVNASSLVGGVIRRVLGIDGRRTLPAFSRSLEGMWDGERDAKQSVDRPRVVLFGDCFTMYNESSIGMATKRVMEAFGYRVELANAGCCGRAKISLGLLPEAIDEIDATLEKLQSVIEDDGVVAVLVAEPSCLSAFKDDWLTLKLKTPMVLRAKLAKKSFLPEQFLHAAWEKHPKRPAMKAPAGRVLLHGHCHQKALWGASSSADMLRRVAGDKLTVLDSGCCGMAGSFGYGEKRFDLSMQIGELVLFPAARGMTAKDVLVAPGTSCRHQVHDGVEKKAVHPMVYLAGSLA